MTRRRIQKLLVMIPIGVLAITLFGFIVMNLWNWLVPALFGGKLITFWQALGVLALSRLLFGGFSRGGRRRWKVVDNWKQLTPEEQEKFRAAMMRKRCGHPGEAGNAPA